ncbi:MAG: FeoB-associated Cys-rich membrane protein [Sphingobacteriales bacterium]|nr:FeoB-associated Cys-rich membrane protein [Sphingobacteriales bacterium]
MDIQVIFVLILFVAAVFYLGKTMLKSFRAKKGCGTNCKCGVDFSNLPQEKS